MIRRLTYFLVIVFTNMYSQDNKTITGKIQLEKQDDFITLRAFVVNNQLIYASELNYNLVALKKGEKGNLSKNNQSGNFSLDPKEEKKVSELKVNIGDDDELKAYLFIKQKDKLIFRDTLFISQNPKTKKKKKQKKVSESNFAIRGIVIDEAITRIGKEFHDIFYKEYIVTRKNYPFIIKIKEKPAMGSRSIISIMAEDKKIHEFYAQPKEDFLKQNVARTMQKLRRYNRVRRNILSY